jgi:hypothetical protein
MHSVHPIGRECASAAADIQARQPASRWVLLLAPSLSACALAALGFAYAAVLLSNREILGKERDLALFVVGALLLAPLCAAVQIFAVRPDFRSLSSRSAEAVNCWTAVALLITLASIPLLMWVTGQSDDFWTRSSGRIVITIGALHVAGLAVAVAQSFGRWISIPAMLCSRAAQVVGLTIAFSLAGIALFWVDASDHYLNLFVRLFFAPPFSGEPGTLGVNHAFLLAACGAAAVAALAWLELGLMRRGATALQPARIAALCVSVGATVVIFFDFSLGSDVAHYLTNVGPALHLIHGGTLLVDTFSQYGPGPVLITLVGLRLGPATFGSAQVSVQICNLAFYGIWLICLYRMTRWKFPALLLGMLSIAFFLAGYIRGYGNVNEAPSILALRYLPALLMVLALSCLRPPRRHSVFTALSTFLAGAWSIETLVGTLGVHLSFLGMLGLRDRDYVRLLIDGVMAVAPAVVAVAVMMLAIMLQSGRWPDYGTYLQFFSSYNPTAAYWSAVANPAFFGWLAMLLAIFIVSADAWTRVFDRTAALTEIDDELLSRRFVPMAALLMVQATYFVGRSHPTSLSLAVLPFCAIAIPAILSVTTAVLATKGWGRLLGSIPIALALWVLTFTFLSLFRQNSPYSLLLHECRDLGRCSPVALARGFDEVLRLRATMDRVKRPINDGLFDTKGIVRDAVTMMARWARDEDAVTVLLGRLLPDVELTASELALMYARKWDRWPRSFVPSDELVTPLAQRIVAAPVRLREGELILVRRDEGALGFIEAGILRRIRAEASLCRIPDSSTEVVAYRVGGPSGCPPDQEKTAH